MKTEVDPLNMSKEEVDEFFDAIKLQRAERKIREEVQENGEWYAGLMIPRQVYGLELKRCETITWDKHELARLTEDGGVEMRAYALSNREKLALTAGLVSDCYNACLVDASMTVDDLLRIISARLQTSPVK